MTGLLIQHTTKSGALKILNRDHSSTLYELDISIVKPAESIPVGIIVMFKGSSNQVPSDWAFCNGNGITPDLRN